MATKFEKYDQVLVDGNALAHAGFDPAHGGAMAHRICQRLLTCLDEGARSVKVLWDTPPRYRLEAYPAYKGNRRGNWEHFQQFDQERSKLQQVLKLLGIGQAVAPGWEADDAIATLACGTEAPTLVMTRDRDLLQLISPSTDVLLRLGSKEQIWDEQAFLAEYRMTSRTFRDYKALVGDSSDNLPGVRSVGPKLASALLERYPDAVERILAGQQIETQDRKLQRCFGLMTTDLENLRLMRWMVTLKDDCRLRWMPKQKDEGLLKAQLARMGLRRVAQRLGLLEDR